MKISKTLLAVSMSAAMIFSVPTSGNGNVYGQAVEAAVSSSCRMNKSVVSLDTGKGIQLTLSNAASSRITWRSSSSSVVSVDSNGYVSAKNAGKATITAKYNGRNYTCKITVLKQKKIELNYQSANVKLGHPIQLKLNNASGSIKWVSKNPGVASVSSTGKVTGMKKGYTKITANYKGKAYSCEVFVVKNTVKSLGEFNITYYDACDKPECSGIGNKDAQGRPIGSAGKPLRANHSIAVDPKVIPYGSEVLINGVVYTAEDSSGTIKGKHIDIYMGDTSRAHKLAEKMGMRRFKVIILN